MEKTKTNPSPISPFVNGFLGRKSLRSSPFGVRFLISDSGKRSDFHSSGVFARRRNVGYTRAPLSPSIIYDSMNISNKVFAEPSCRL